MERYLDIGDPEIPSPEVFESKCNYSIIFIILVVFILGILIFVLVNNYVKENYLKERYFSVTTK